jgi:hypothetical protein
MSINPGIFPVSLQQYGGTFDISPREPRLRIGWKRPLFRVPPPRLLTKRVFCQKSARHRITLIRVYQLLRGLAADDRAVGSGPVTGNISGTSSNGQMTLATEAGPHLFPRARHPRPCPPAHKVGAQRSGDPAGNLMAERRDVFGRSRVIITDDVQSVEALAQIAQCVASCCFSSASAQRSHSSANWRNNLAMPRHPPGGREVQHSLQDVNLLVAGLGQRQWPQSIFGSSWRVTPRRMRRRHRDPAQSRCHRPGSRRAPWLRQGGHLPAPCVRPTARSDPSSARAATRPRCQNPTAR